MMSWTLFIFHKLLMVVILYSSVRIILDKAKSWHVIIVSGFLITQAVFGNCIITALENIVRPLDGMQTVANDFILSSVTSTAFTPILRLLFALIGILLLVQQFNLLERLRNSQIKKG